MAQSSTRTGRRLTRRQNGRIIHTSFTPPHGDPERGRLDREAEPRPNEARDEDKALAPIANAKAKDQARPKDAPQ